MEKKELRFRRFEKVEVNDNLVEIMFPDTVRVRILTSENEHITLVEVPVPEPQFPNAKTLWEWTYPGARVTWMWKEGEPHGETWSKYSRRVLDRLSQDKTFLGRVMGLDFAS